MFYLCCTLLEWIMTWPVPEDPRLCSQTNPSLSTIFVLPVMEQLRRVGAGFPLVRFNLHQSGVLTSLDQRPDQKNIVKCWETCLFFFIWIREDFIFDSTWRKKKTGNSKPGKAEGGFGQMGAGGGQWGYWVQNLCEHEKNKPNDCGCQKCPGSWSLKHKHSWHFLANWYTFIRRV